jgi:uracil phosphoribosyltransferase
MLIKITNPLIAHYLGEMRNKHTNSKNFNIAIEKLIYLMAGEVFKDFPVQEKVVATPICDTNAIELSDKICLIPIMRAGLSMLPPMQDILPCSTTGFLGIKRIYSSLDNSQADLYYSSLPEDIADYNVFLLEVVMASGTTLAAAIQHLTAQGVKPQNINIISFIACDVSINKVEQIDAAIKIFTCDLDEVRESDGYLVPGLGDAGDRYSNN